MTEDPAWTQPTSQFIKYVLQVANLLNLTERGIRHVIRYPDVIAALEMDNESDETESKPQLEDAKKMAELGRSEIVNDFPLLRSHALIGLWGALEAMIEDLAITWIQYNPSLLDEPKIAKIKVPLAEYRKMDEQDQLSFLVSELQRDLGSDLKGGVNKFESLLNVIGIGGPVDKRVRDVIFEAQNLRNVLAHRAGIADRKFIMRCPHFNYSAGDRVKISKELLDHVMAGFLTYSFIVFNRCATIDEYSKFTVEPADFEGAVNFSGDDDA